MPLYEYICEATGQTVELMRPMSQADTPPTDAELEAALGPDPEHQRKDRRFVRKLSTFQAKSDAGRRVPLPTPGGMGGGMGGGCGCGNPHGPCGNG